MSDIEIRRPIATVVARHLPGFPGDVTLFQLDEPVRFNEWDGTLHTTTYVLTSSVSNGYVHETLVFPSSADGEILDFLQLGGAGFDQPRAALENAGIVAPTDLIDADDDGLGTAERAATPMSSLVDLLAMLDALIRGDDRTDGEPGTSGYNSFGI